MASLLGTSGFPSPIEHWALIMSIADLERSYAAMAAAETSKHRRVLKDRVAN
jgi:hypothetical protein